jgi:hypothetical protein
MELGLEIQRPETVSPLPRPVVHLELDIGLQKTAQAYDMLCVKKVSDLLLYLLKINKKLVQTNLPNVKIVFL